MARDRVYKSISYLCKRLALNVCRWSVSGLEHVPRAGPAIIASNHVSYIDPPLLASLIHRPIRFMAKEEVFEMMVIGKLARLTGSFPVRRGRIDVAAVRSALRVLQRGEVLGIFPEGTRNRNRDLQTLQPFREGVGWLAIRAGCPVIPVAISGYAPLGTTNVWTRPTRLRVTCGAPISFDKETFPTSRRPHRTDATERVYAMMSRLLGSSQAELKEVRSGQPVRT